MCKIAHRKIREVSQLPHKSFLSTGTGIVSKNAQKIKMQNEFPPTTLYFPLWTGWIRTKYFGNAKAMPQIAYLKSCDS